MKFSFWQWLGIVVLLLIVGGIVFRLIYGNKLIDTAKQISDQNAAATAAFLYKSPDWAEKAYTSN